MSAARNMFKGCLIAVELDTSYAFKEKQKIRKTITDHGGTVSFILNRKVESRCNAEAIGLKTQVFEKCRVSRPLQVVKTRTVTFCCQDGVNPMHAQVYVVVVASRLGKAMGLKTSTCCSIHACV